MAKAETKKIDTAPELTREPPITEEQAAEFEVLDAPSYYANNMRITMGKYDVRLVFGEFLPAAPKTPKFAIPDVQINKARATVVMSHHHFKSMLEVMLAAVGREAEKLNVQSIYFPDNTGEEQPGAEAPE